MGGGGLGGVRLTGGGESGQRLQLLDDVTMVSKLNDI